MNLVPRVVTIATAMSFKMWWCIIYPCPQNPGMGHFATSSRFGGFSTFGPPGEGGRRVRLYRPAQAARCVHKGGACAV